MRNFIDVVNKSTILGSLQSDNSRDKAVVEDAEAMSVIINQRFHALVTSLKQSPLATKIKIFGSAASKKENPGDIDLFVDLRGGEMKDARHLLHLAAKFYGMLDPFVLIEIRGRAQLITRNDEANGWQIARNTKALLAAGQAGIPFEAVEWPKAWMQKQTDRGLEKT